MSVRTFYLIELEACNIHILRKQFLECCERQNRLPSRAGGNSWSALSTMHGGYVCYINIQCYNYHLLCRFPAVLGFLRGKGFNDSLYEEEMFAGADYGLEEVKAWIEKQDSTKAPKSKIGSKALEAPVIKLIEEEIEKVP